MTGHAISTLDQELKLNLLSKFKQCSSSELSFLRRTSTLYLLEALCYTTGLSAQALFIEENQKDWMGILNDNRNEPLVKSFMLTNNINPESIDFSESEKEAIIWCIMELSQHITSL